MAFNSRTVFIIGAGASVEAGYQVYKDNKPEPTKTTFPTGKELKAKILQMINAMLERPKYSDLTPFYGDMIEFKPQNGYYNTKAEFRGLAFIDTGGNHRTTTNYYDDYLLQLLGNYIKYEDEKNLNLVYISNEKQKEISKTLHETFDVIKNSLLHSTSIDDCVKKLNNDEYTPFAKSLIAYQILQAETKSLIKKELYDKLEDTWYFQFLNMLDVDKVDEIFNNVTIINFNYDRCIEVYLYNAIKKSYGLDDNRTAEIMNKLVTIRPHGSLGQLERQGTAEVQFGNIETNAFTAAENIRTCHDKNSEKDEIITATKESISNALESAQKIVFLGFGFHEANTKILYPHFQAHHHIYGTAYGEAEIDAIKEEMAAKSKNEILLKDEKCNNFLIGNKKKITA